MLNLEKVKEELKTKEQLFFINNQKTEISKNVTEDEDGLFDCDVESCRGRHYIIEWETPDIETNKEYEKNTIVCGKGVEWISENIAIIR